MGCGHNPFAHKSIPWNKPKAEDLEQLSFRSVDDSVTEHASEKRGFVSVPLNYENPEQKKIKLFYRFIPHDGSRGFKDQSKPVMVVINDGPGLSSESLRAYDAEAKKTDNLTFFLKDYDVLLVDQRGTGYSSPIDTDNSDLKPELIANYFDSDDIAKDYAQVIESLIPGRPFYLLGLGYGGLALYSYIFHNKAPRPQSFIFANSSLPPYGFLKKYRSQRRLQYGLNLQMQRSDSAFKKDIRTLRKRLREEGGNPNAVNSLYSYMGGRNSKEWKTSLREELNKLLEMDSSDLEDHFEFTEKGPDLLRYVLSARSHTPGMTQRKLFKYFQKKLPLNPWMLDGFWQDSYLGDLEDTWKADWIRWVDKNPPPSTEFPSIRQLSSRFQRTPSLFIFGRDDKSSQTQFRRRELRWFKSPKVQVVEVPGKGEFIFEKGGVQLVKRILEKK